jgi:hypothetical protein
MVRHLLEVLRHRNRAEPDGPVPLHKLVYEMLLSWRSVTAYGGDGDFPFPSERLNGEKPLPQEVVLRKIIQPALVRASVQGKVINWHSFP